MTPTQTTTLFPAPETSFQKPWARASDGIFAGVCKGLADRLGVDPWLVRVLWLLAVCVFGTGLAIYIMLAIAFPRADKMQDAHKKKLLGVCYRLSKNSDLDLGLTRFLCIILACLSLGGTVIAYIVLSFILPWPATNQRLLSENSASVTHQNPIDAPQSHPIG